MKTQTVTKVAGASMAKASPLQLVEGMKAMADAYKEWNRITEQEQTKRQAIDAWKQCQLKKLNDQREMMELYFQKTYAERAQNFSELFARLDKGIELGDPTLVAGCLQGIVDIAKTSPLAGVKEIFQALDDPNVNEIVI